MHLNYIEYLIRFMYIRCVNLLLIKALFEQKYRKTIQNGCMEIYMTQQKMPKWRTFQRCIKAKNGIDVGSKAFGLSWLGFDENGVKVRR